MALWWNLEDTLVLETSAIAREGANPSRAIIFASTRSVLTRSCKSRSPEHGRILAPIKCRRDEYPAEFHKLGFVGATPTPATCAGIPLKRRASL